LARKQKAAAEQVHALDAPRLKRELGFAVADAIKGGKCLFRDRRRGEFCTNPREPGKTHCKKHRRYNTASSESRAAKFAETRKRKIREEEHAAEYRSVVLQERLRNFFGQEAAREAKREAEKALAEEDLLGGVLETVKRKRQKTG